MPTAQPPVGTHECLSPHPSEVYSPTWKEEGVLLAPGPREPCSLTWQEEGGSGGNVDLLKMLQSLRVEEADGRTRGEGHPDTTAGFHHVSDTHRLILVRLEAVLHTEGMEEVSGQLPP